MASSIGVNGSQGPNPSSPLSSSLPDQNVSLFHRVFDRLTHFFARLIAYEKISQAIKRIFEGYLEPAIKFFPQIFKNISISKKNKLFSNKLDSLRDELSKIRESICHAKYIFINSIDLEKDTKKIFSVKKELALLELSLKPLIDAKALLVKENSDVLNQLLKDLELVKNEFKNVLKEKMPAAFQMFEKIVNYLKNPIPEDIQKEIISAGLLIREMSKDEDYPRKQHFLDNLSNLLPQTPKEIEQSLTHLECSSQLILRNIGNSCYIAAAIQALFNTNIARNLARQKLVEHNPKKPIPGELTNRKVVQQKLLDLFDFFENKPRGFFQYCLFLNPLANNPLMALRQAIFESNLHAEFYTESIGQQLDASSMIELFMTEILTEKILIQKMMIIDNIPGRAKFGPVDSNPILQINFRPEAASENDKNPKEKFFSLQKLVDFELLPRIETDPFRFAAKDFEIVDPVKAAEDRQFNPAATYNSKYQTQYFIRGLPEVLAIQVKRFFPYMKNGEFRKRKIQDPIILPPNGILDLSQHTKLKEDDKGSTKFKLMGIVEHRSSSCDGGHYVAKFVKNGRYFAADDETVERIPESEFYGNKNGYIFIFNRCNEDLV